MDSNYSLSDIAAVTDGNRNGGMFGGNGDWGAWIILFLLFGLFGSKPYYAMQSNVADIVEGGAIYTTLCCCLTAGIFFEILFERMLQATGKTKLSMVAQMTGAIINIIMDPILIFGLLGFPAMGVAGAAIATVFGQFCGAITAMVLHLKYNKEIHLSFKGFRPNGHVIGIILGVGVPSIIMASIGSVMTYSMNRILNGFTSTAVAVFGIYFKLQSFIFMPVFGMNNAIVPIIAYNYGARHPDRMKKTIKLACAVAMTIMFCGFLLMQFIPHVFLGFFDASADMLSIGVPALRTISISFLAAGACIIIGSSFQALGKGVYSMCVSIARQLVVLLPAAYLLSLSGNVNLVWLAYPIAEIASIIIILLLYARIYKKKIRPLFD